MEAYDPRRNVWLKLADMGSPCSGLGACALFGLLYTVGQTINDILHTFYPSSFSHQLLPVDPEQTNIFWTEFKRT